MDQLTRRFAMASPPEPAAPNYLKRNRETVDWLHIGRYASSVSSSI